MTVGPVEAALPTDVDELIRWMAGQGATLRETKRALAEAGLHEWLRGMRVYHRARSLGVHFRPEFDQVWAPLPMAMSLFPRLSPTAREQLAELAESADQPAGLTLAEYEVAKARILSEHS